jgi:eukaryotic-like serine/threonine-protein kinase
LLRRHRRAYDRRDVMSSDDPPRPAGSPLRERDVETMTIPSGAASVALLPNPGAATRALPTGASPAGPSGDRERPQPPGAFEALRPTAPTVLVTPPEGSAPAAGVALPERYQDIRLLGSGGFGEVRLVFDRNLERTVAMKILRPEALAPETRARFLAEIKLTAGLHHPGIVAVHDHGELPDGRLWFTMAEVRGRTLRAVLDEAFAAGGSVGGAAGGTVSSVVRRRLLDVFARACEAVAYAHSSGVIHRDLKPDNVMVGDFGRVLVMDWGIARRRGAALEAKQARRFEPPEPSPDGLTRSGDILGTPAYMAPEQARGDVERHGPATDVYALGAILYYVLAGRPPYTVAGIAGWREVLAGRPAPLDASGAPPELVAICEKAMAAEPERRHTDAGALAAEVEAFLVGAQRRERALAELAKAAALGPEVARLRARAEALHAEAKRLLDPVWACEPVEAKLPGWERQDEAERLTQEAALAETRWEQEVHGALAIDPELPEVHEALAAHYRDKLIEAERAHRDEDAARFEVLLRGHHRGHHAAFLQGIGALSLVTDPPGATVLLERFVRRGRRLVAEPARELGPTPLRAVPLDRGSYLLRLRAPGRAEVRYPVLIERDTHWDGIPPGEAEPFPIPLPREGEIGRGEVYVPAGWCWTGGDAAAIDGLPRRRIWIDGFVLGRFPVTNAEYVAFLNDLVASGREAEALVACPRFARSLSETAADLLYGRDAAGRFVLTEGVVGQESQPDWPVVLIDWHGASAHARWRAAREGSSFRLPEELEREKAARGADGRVFPWGDHFDATWACVCESHVDVAARVGVDRFPLDESPYGARGLAGNVRDWCANVWTRAGPEIRGGRPSPAPAPAGDLELRAARGGAWKSIAELSRAAVRFANRPQERWTTTGLRLARSYDAPTR